MGKRASKRRRRRSVLKEIGPRKSETRPSRFNRVVATNKTIQDVVEVSQVEPEKKMVSRPKMKLWNFRLRIDQLDWLRGKAQEGYNMNELLRRLVDEEIKRDRKLTKLNA